MNKHAMTLTAVLGSLAAVPSLALAATPNGLAGQCFEAFEAKLSQKFTPAPRVSDTRLLDAPDFSGLQQAGSNEYTMAATNPRNHEVVLRASCVVTGGVVSLRELPSHTF